ncbi:MAG: MFS transporter [Thermoflexales bacterium]|nr:MFS transporter [Thermoflexales bacterium]
MRLWNAIIPYGDRVFRRNFALNVGNGALSALGDAFTNSVVMTSFVSQLTSSNVLVALLVQIKDGGWFLPQFFIAPAVERAPLKIVLYRRTTMLRVVAWALIVAMALLITDKGALLIGYSVCISFVALSAGMAGLPWQTITAKIIPARHRGHLFGMRQFTGSILGIFGSAMLALILSGGMGLTFPRNYALIFGLAAISFLVAYAMFGRSIEPPDPPVATQTSLRSMVNHAGTILRTNSRYRAFLVLRGLLFLGNASVPFITVYARRGLGADDGYIGAIAVLTIVVGLLTNLMWGRIVDRLGAPRAGGFIALSGLAATLIVAALALARPDPQLALLLLLVPFSLSTMATTGIGVVGSPMLMEIVPADDRVRYFGLTNTVLGLLMLSTSAVGAIGDQSGYGALFAICAVAFLAALFFARRLRAPAPTGER